MQGARGRLVHDSCWLDKVNAVVGGEARQLSDHKVRSSPDTRIHPITNIFSEVHNKLRQKGPILWVCNLISDADRLLNPRLHKV